MVADHPRGVLPAYVTGGGRGEFLDVGGRHHHRDGAVDRSVDEPVLVPQRLEEVVHNVRPAVQHRRRRVAGVVAHHVKAVAGWCVLLVAVGKRRSVRDARGQLLCVALEVCVYDEGSAQLVVLVLEREGGVVSARHLHPLGPVQLAVRDVVGPAEDVQAVDVREADSIVSGSWGDEPAQVIDQDVVPLLPVGQQEQVHVVWSVAELGQAERVDDGVLVAEDVDRHRVLGLEAPDVPDGDGGRDAGHVELRLEVGVIGEALRVAKGGAVDGVEPGPPTRNTCLCSSR